MTITPSVYKLFNHKKLLTRKRSFSLFVIILTFATFIFYQLGFFLVEKGYLTNSTTTTYTTNTNVKNLYKDSCSCDIIKLYNLWDGAESFVSYTYKGDFIIDNREIVIENMHNGMPICVIVALPKSALIKKFTHHNIFARAISNQIVQPIPMTLTKNHSNIFSGLTYIKYPGNYSINVDLEINEDYNIFFQSKNKLILALNDRSLLPNDGLPYCTSNSDLSGFWMSEEYYNSFHPYTHYKSMVKVDNALYVPTKCKMRYASPIEQLICMSDRTIHAYGDEILWSNLYGTSVGHGGDWCDGLPENEPSVCDCKVPSFTLLPELPFAHLKSKAFNGSIYFQPIRIIQNLELSKKIFMKDQIPKEDIVLVSVSNDILINYSIHSLERMLTRFFNKLRKIYPISPIIIRTPEPYTLISYLNTTTRALSQQVRNSTITIAKNIGAYLWDAGVIDGGEWITGSKCFKDKQLFRTDIAELQLQILFNIYCKTMLD